MVMALGSSDVKSPKQCKILKEKIVRKEKLILLLKELLQVKDKTTHENVSQQLLSLRSRGQEANANLKKELFLTCNSTNTIAQQLEVNRKTIGELSLSLEEKHGTIKHLEFQNKQLVVVQQEHEKTIDTLKESIKTLEKKVGTCSSVLKVRKKKLKDKSLGDPPPTPASSVSSFPETSKAFPQPKGILTPASSIASSIRVPDGPCSPGIGWLDLDSRSNSPSTSLSEVFDDLVPPLLTPIQSAIKKPPCDDQSMPCLSKYDRCKEPPAVSTSENTNELKVMDMENLLKSECHTSDSVGQNRSSLSCTSVSLVNGNQSTGMARLGSNEKSKPTSAVSIFDLPNDSESEDECGPNSLKEKMVSTPHTEQSFKHEDEESILGCDLDMSNSDLDSELNYLLPDLDSTETKCSKLDTPTSHFTEEVMTKRESDEVVDDDHLRNDCLPDLIECIGTSSVARDAAINFESGAMIDSSACESHATFGHSSHIEPEAHLTEKLERDDELNPMSCEDTEVIENPITTCMQSDEVSEDCVVGISTTGEDLGVDISTMGDVESTDQSPHQQTSTTDREILPICSPIPGVSHDSFPSGDSSPLQNEVRETDVPPNVLTTSSSKEEPRSSKCTTQSERNTPTRHKIDCDADSGNDSTSQEVDLGASENVLRQTRSKSITPKKTTGRKTRQSAREPPSTIIVESPKIPTRRTRRKSTLDDVGTPQLRRSVRISSLKETVSSDLKQKKRSVRSRKSAPVQTSDCEVVSSQSVTSVDNFSSSRLKNASYSTDTPSTGSKKSPRGNVKRTIPSKNKCTVGNESYPERSRSSRSAFKSPFVHEKSHLQSRNEVYFSTETDADQPSLEPAVSDSESSTSSKFTKTDLAPSEMSADIRSISQYHQILSQELSDLTIISENVFSEIKNSGKPSEPSVRNSTLVEAAPHLHRNKVIGHELSGVDAVNTSSEKDVSKRPKITNADRIMHPLQPPKVFGQPVETSYCKNLPSSGTSSVPGTLSSNIPSLRNGNNILCSARAAIQSFSSPFSKSFYSGSTIFGCQNLPSFSDLKPDSNRSSSETSYWKHGANFKPQDASYLTHRQRKRAEEHLICGSPEDDVDNLLIGQLCLSLNLLSIKPSHNNDNFFNFFSKFKKEDVSTVDEYSSTFLPPRPQSVSVTERPTVSFSDYSNFTNYRDVAGSLKEACDKSSEVTIEIKQEDTPFSLKLSVPAGKPLEPVLDSLCGMVRDVQSKRTPFGAHRQFARNATESVSNVPTRNTCAENYHHTSGTFQDPKLSAYRTSSLDRSNLFQSNDRFFSTNYQFKNENKTMPSCQRANDVIKQPCFPPIVSPQLTSSSNFSASKSIKPPSESPKVVRQSNFEFKTSRLDIEVARDDENPNNSDGHASTDIPPLPTLNICNPVACLESLQPIFDQDHNPNARPPEKSALSNAYDMCLPVSAESSLGQNQPTSPYHSTQINRNHNLIKPAANINTSASCQVTLSNTSFQKKTTSPIEEDEEPKRVLNEEEMNSCGVPSPKTKESGCMTLDTQQICEDSQVDASVPPNEMSSEDTKAQTMSLISFVPSENVDALPTQLSLKICEDSQAEAPIPPIEMLSEDSKAQPMPWISFVPSESVDASPNQLSPNLNKSASSLYESDDSLFEVVAKKPRFARSPRKEVGKSDNISSAPLTEQQKTEVLLRQSLRKLPVIGPPQKSDVSVMIPPATTSKMLHSSNISPDLGGTLTGAKPKNTRKQVSAPSRKLVSKQSIAVKAIDQTCMSSGTMVMMGDDPKEVDDHEMCSQCHLKTAFCACEIERIMAEMIYFCPLLSPLPDSPEPVDFENPIPLAINETSGSGGSENNTMDLLMVKKEVSETPRLSVDISTPVEECNGKESNKIRTKRKSRKTEETLERRRSGRKKNEVIAGKISLSNDSEFISGIRAKWLMNGCENLDKNSVVDISNNVSSESSTMHTKEDKSHSDLKNRVTSENDNDILFNTPDEGTVKRKLRSSTRRPEFVATDQKDKSDAPKRSRAGRPRKECSSEKNADDGNSVSENNMVGEDVDSICSNSSEEHTEFISSCSESGISSPKPKEEVVELVKMVEVDRNTSSDEDPVEEVPLKFTASSPKADLVKLEDSHSQYVESNQKFQIADRLIPSSSKIETVNLEKSVDLLLESIGAVVPVSQITQNRVEQPNLHRQPQPVESRTAFDPLSHLGKFFKKNNSTVEPQGVEGPGTSNVTLGLETDDDDSESGMVVDYSSSSESELRVSTQQNEEANCSAPPEEINCNPPPEETQEPRLCLAAEKRTTPSNHSNVASQNYLPNFYTTVLEGTNTDENNESKFMPSDEIAIPCQLPPSIQLPKFYTAVQEETKAPPQEELEPKKLAMFSSDDKIFSKLISEEDVIPCSINVLAFASYYDLKDTQDQSMSKLTVPYVKHQQKIENCMNEFLSNNKDLQNGLKKAVASLKNMDAIHIGKALSAIVGSSHIKTEPDEKMSTPSFFTKIQKRAVLLVTALANGRFQYFTDVLNEIEEFMIPSPKAPNSSPAYVSTNLASFYTLLCRTQGFGLRVQSFIYDLLYGRHISGFRIINQILLTIPQAIPRAQDKMIGPLTFTIVYIIMKQGIYKNLTPQYLITTGVTPLRKRLKVKYGYSFPQDITRDTVMEELMSNVMVKGCDKAIILLSKSQGYKWTFSVVQKYVFPVVDRWLSGDETDEDLVARFIRLLGLVSRCFAISVCESFVSVSIAKFRSIIQKNPSLLIFEAATEALIHFKRLNPEAVIKIFSSWTPHDHKITKSCVRTLRMLFREKPHAYWKQFMES